MLLVAVNDRTVVSDKLCLDSVQSLTELLLLAFEGLPHSSEWFAAVADFSGTHSLAKNGQEPHKQGTIH